METIEGHKLPLTLKKIADLLYHDGPFVSLFEDKEEKAYYIYWWCDVDQKCNRWLIFKVNQKQIKDYLDADLSMREIVMKTEFFFLCDINNDAEHESVYFITSSQLPESYIPGTKSFFDPELAGISDEDLFILNNGFVRDSAETIKQTSNIVPFAPIKTSDLAIPSHTTNLETEIRNVA